MQIHLFGSSTGSGESFRRLVLSSCSEYSLFLYSRQNPSSESTIHYADFTKPSTFFPAGDPGAPCVWISFGPLSHFSTFVETLHREYPERLLGLQAIVACSSSSVLSKRFSFNRSDQELSSRLLDAENKLLSISQLAGLRCCIIRPTIIYGNISTYPDRNLSRIVSLLSFLPVIPFPSRSGLRQPIHVSQLASVVLQLSRKLMIGPSECFPPERISIGGDTTLTYESMIRSLQASQSSSHGARRCYLFLVPNRLFYFLLSPILLFSPKLYDALLRIGANLSGFTPSHQLLNSHPKPFPLPSIR